MSVLDWCEAVYLVALFFGAFGFPVLLFLWDRDKRRHLHL